MLSAGYPGFVNVPVTKALVTIVVLTTVFGSIIGSQSRLTLRIDDVISKLHLWRLITHNLVFTTPGELLFGVLLLYYFRQFERQMGSSRFAAYLIFTSTVYTAILTIFQLIFPRASPASGPYALIFASVVYFFFETPKLYHYQLLGLLELSDKSFVYVVVFELICSSPPRSLLSFIAGAAAGMLYRIPVIRGNADIPEAIVAPCSLYILPFMGTTQRMGGVRSSRARPFIDVSAPGRSRRGGRHARGRDDDETPLVVSESNVETLVAMGFSRERAIASLQQTNDDVQQATEQLLTTSG